MTFLLELSHSCKHLMCMSPLDPLQWQGDTIGSSLTSLSSQRQILHVCFLLTVCFFKRDLRPPPKVLSLKSTEFGFLTLRLFNLFSSLIISRPLLCITFFLNWPLMLELIGTSASIEPVKLPPPPLFCYRCAPAIEGLIADRCMISLPAASYPGLLAIWLLSSTDDYSW